MRNLALGIFFLPALIGWADPHRNLRARFDFEAYEQRIFQLTNHKHVRVFSIGQSHDGRNIWVIEINPVQPTDISVLLLGTSHPIEWHAHEIPMRLAEHLVHQASRLRARCYIIPIFNPDGFAYMRVIPIFYGSNRKNRFFPPTETRPSVFAGGVDINRNFSYRWRKTSSNPAYPFYSGTAPMSEPENQALARFVSNTPLHFALSFHAPGKAVRYPWGYTRAPLQNQRLISLARWMASTIGRGYRAVQDSASSIKTGTEIDWFYGEHQILALRLSVSDRVIDTRMEDYPAIQNMIDVLLSEKLPW